MNVNHTYNKLLIENYVISSHTRAFHAIIIIQLYQESYEVELEVYNANFTALNNTIRLFDVIQTVKTLNCIKFSQLIIQNFFVGYQVACSNLNHLGTLM